MSIRWKIIEYSRGNNLTWFWRFYRLQKATKLLFFRDIFVFFMSRSGPPPRWVRRPGYGISGYTLASTRATWHLYFSICRYRERLLDLSECDDWRSERERPCDR